MSDITEKSVIRLTDAVLNRLIGSKPLNPNKDLIDTVDENLEVLSLTEAFIEEVLETAYVLGDGGEDAEWAVCEIDDCPAFFVYPKVDEDTVFRYGNHNKPDELVSLDVKVFGITVTISALNQLMGDYEHNQPIYNMLDHKKSALIDIITLRTQELADHTKYSSNPDDIEEYQTNELMEDFISSQAD